MPLNNGYLFLILYCLCNISVSSNNCQKGDEACSTLSYNSQLGMAIKETMAYEQKLLEKHDRSVAEYIPCSSKNCSCFLNVIKADLEQFKNGITKKMITDVRQKGSTYVIFQNRLYRSKDCVFPARCSGVEHFILELLPKLPNMEFVLNSRDWPQVNKYFGEKGPVLSFSKTSDYLDIHFPAWSFWEGGPAITTYPRGIGRWDILRKNLLLESEKWLWENKVDKGFFRGSRTSEERDALILLSRKHPDLIDAQYTKNQAWKSPADTLHADPAAVVTFEHHCRYKYLFNLRGVAASFRFKHLFLCGSLVINFGDEWSEFFYSALKPWIHYVPISAKASQEEIASLMDFLRKHDDLAAGIAKRGQEFIKEHLRMKDVRCYFRQLLRRYAKLIKYPITLDPNLEEIK